MIFLVNIVIDLRRLLLLSIIIAVLRCQFRAFSNLRAHFPLTFAVLMELVDLDRDGFLIKTDFFLTDGDEADVSLLFGSGTLFRKGYSRISLVLNWIFRCNRIQVNVINRFFLGEGQLTRF